MERHIPTTHLTKAMENPLPWQIKNKQLQLSISCKLPATHTKEVYVNRLMHLCRGQNYYRAKGD